MFLPKVRKLYFFNSLLLFLQPNINLLFYLQLVDKCVSVNKTRENYMEMFIRINECRLNENISIMKCINCELGQYKNKNEMNDDTNTKN
jgi:hypothetical protein